MGGAGRGVGGAGREWEELAGEWEEPARASSSGPGVADPSVPWAELSLEPHVLRGPQESGFSLRKA